ncbi:unnamed protein product [Leptosia nina]|uniref:TRAFD1/XAF1 zinc finger domain-containing protein n=1 Tax=Leptosia nina TaxID=320188 RepID=A0AAV1JS68_9NEOP
MDGDEIKTCGNCKREIPVVNFTIHRVYCTRNICMCPVCKEPILQAELQDHHDKMHKLSPCKQCGESVCGTDLEDHVRDSCAHTMKTCRYCNLDVRRGELPAHERYCGARTEQCEECGEWVMLKYRRLHTESNHGFIRLDDDPPPFRKDTPKTIINDWPKYTSGEKRQNTASRNQNPFELMFPPSTPADINDMNSLVNTLKDTAEPRASGSINGAVPKPKRTNDQPQINTISAPPDKIKNMSLSRGAIKKRPAPKPPVQPPRDPKREVAYEKVLQRRQKEEQERRDQNKLNLACGLPPVLSPLEKLEKLRKMDALHNRDAEDQSYKNKLKGRVWMTPEVSAGQMLGADTNGIGLESANNLAAERRRGRPSEVPGGRDELRNLTPMSQEEFAERFNELRLREGEGAGGRPRDRFVQIKSSLRELRRGLNEVTAPYNANPNVDLNQNRNSPSPEDEVRLPCEFCGAPVPADLLVQHQTGCRPDLARVRPVPEGAGRSGRTRSPPLEAVIPCEFCAESLPIYLINEHQERCGRDGNLLFPD